LPLSSICDIAVSILCILLHFAAGMKAVYCDAN
jgi:hypothetical protein